MNCHTAGIFIHFVGNYTLVSANCITNSRIIYKLWRLAIFPKCSSFHEIEWFDSSAVKIWTLDRFLKDPKRGDWDQVISQRGATGIFIFGAIIPLGLNEVFIFKYFYTFVGYLCFYIRNIVAAYMDWTTQNPYTVYRFHTRVAPSALRLDRVLHRNFATLVAASNCVFEHVCNL